MARRFVIDYLCCTAPVFVVTAETSRPLIVSEQYRALPDDPELPRKLPNSSRAFLFALKTHFWRKPKFLQFSGAMPDYRAFRTVGCRTNGLLLYFNQRKIKIFYHRVRENAMHVLIIAEKVASNHIKFKWIK